MVFSLKDASDARSLYDIPSSCFNNLAILKNDFIEGDTGIYNKGIDGIFLSKT